MFRSKFNLFFRKHLSILKWLGLSFFLFIFFQNCSPANFSKWDLSEKAGQGNGGGYEGKLYTHQDFCNDHLSVQAAIKDLGPAGGLWLTRENCADLSQWLPLQSDQVIKSTHDDSVVAYRDRAFDLTTTIDSQPAKRTAAFCLGNSLTTQLEASVWQPAFQRNLIANVFNGTKNSTGNLNLMPPQTINSFSTLYQSAPEYHILIGAYGQMAFNVWPLMGLYLDESSLHTFSVASSSPLTYSFKSRQIPGSHDLKISFDNDAATADKSQDRNLFLQGVTITSLATGSQTNVDLTRMIAADPFGAENMPNGELALWRETTVHQSVPFPNTLPDRAFVLTATVGPQSSQLEYLPAGSTAPQSSAATCYLQPTGN